MKVRNIIFIDAAVYKSGVQISPMERQTWTYSAVHAISPALHSQFPEKAVFQPCI
ncbi:hypothetical protein [Sediminibacillus albus]|uniref:hypothetical protein n=1 Tax=Sediminibacillus albus TaxID=407036 RepID=UPI001587FA5C|nr:hypothetical protein [Sediminibacillus albus]